MSDATRARSHPALSERQAAVLRAVVASYVGGGAPVGSRTLSHVLPVPVSPASVRNTLAELSALGLVVKPHASAGRVPTERGLRLFVDALATPADLAPSERRDIAYRFESVGVDDLVHVASELLSRHTRQLGFVVAPRLEGLVLRHVSVVKLASERLLVVLVADSGASYRCIVDDLWGFDQRECDRITAILNERVHGCTLHRVRERLERDARELRSEASRLLRSGLDLGRRALEAADGAGVDVVIATRLALLEQPEFRDSRRIRDVFEAIERKERLLQVVDEMLAGDGVSVAIGEELDDPGLRRCAVVATPYGDGGEGLPLGVLGVIGPSRMDFNRVIPLVDYLSEVVTGRLRA